MSGKYKSDFEKHIVKYEKSQIASPFLAKIMRRMGRKRSGYIVLPYHTGMSVT